MHHGARRDNNTPNVRAERRINYHVIADVDLKVTRV
jgi:hypothetical protein